MIKTYFEVSNLSMTTMTNKTKKVLGEGDSNLAPLNKNLHHTIDATGEKLGRVASRAAKILMGKNSASYTPHILRAVGVTIKNAGKLYVTDKKKQQKVYTTYSGHPGGQKRETLASLIGRKGHTEALKRAIERMLPRNATRTARMKLLKITE